MSKLRKAERNRAMAIGGVLTAMLIATGYSQAKVQVLDRQEIINKAIEAKRYERESTSKARRGTIYSSDGRVLAQSEDVYVFGINTAKCPMSSGFFMALADASGISVAELREVQFSDSRSRYWTDPISSDRYEKIRNVMKDWSADGVSLERIPRRVYPLMESASTVIGAILDKETKTGLEAGQDILLTGSDGKATGFVDRTGVFMPIKDKDIKDRQNGEDVVLTIDSEIQSDATRAIRAAVESHAAKRGTVVVVDPANGDILAMANWPAFTPGKPILPGEDYNSAVMSALEPGSTFKILTLAMALDAGAVSLNQTTQCTGSIAISGGRRAHCSHGAHGLVDNEKFIAESCNVAATDYAYKIGREHFQSELKRMQMFEKSTLGLPGERKGVYNEDDPAKMMQLSNNGFGQAMNVTPVRISSAFAALANNGEAFEPRLIKEIGGEAIAPKSLGQFFKPETADYVRGVMVSTIEKEYGTAKNLRVPGYRLAGKTGTAQKLQGKGQKGWVSNFVGFVPAEKPRAMVLVMIDEPAIGYYGGVVAGPVFSDVAKSVIRRYQVPSVSE